MALGKGEVDGIPLKRYLSASPTAGWGPLRIVYVAYIEQGTGVRPANFIRRVESILADERGWIRGGKVAFQRVESGGNTQLVLATPDTVDALCAPLDTAGEVSCNQGTKVVINCERWKHAVEHWTGTLGSYRQMVVNHEFGHRTGKGHGYCADSPTRDVAPVMQQQTYGLQGCRANSWPLDGEL